MSQTMHNKALADDEIYERVVSYQRRRMLMFMALGVSLILGHLCFFPSVSEWLGLKLEAPAAVMTILFLSGSYFVVWAVINLYRLHLMCKSGEMRQVCIETNEALIVRDRIITTSSNSNN